MLRNYKFMFSIFFLLKEDILTRALNAYIEAYHKYPSMFLKFTFVDSTWQGA